MPAVRNTAPGAARGLIEAGGRVATAAWFRRTRTAAVFTAALTAGCYESDVPLDTAPTVEVEEALIGTWRCLPFEADADEEPATLTIRRGPERRYDVGWQETDKAPDRYEAFASRVSSTPFFNLQEVKPTGERGKWAFLRAELLRPAILHVQIVTDDALKGVEKSPPAIRQAIERQLSSERLTMDFALCVRAKKTDESVER
jgi:hypothetical protein